MRSSISTSADAGVAAHLAYLEAAVAAARAAPLSAKKAMLAAMLVDAYADRLMPEGGDILAFRAELAAESAALSLIFALCSGRATRLVTEGVEVPIADYPKLGVEDFMVSLYNDHTVQRVRIVAADGSRHDVHAVIEEAVAALKAV